MKKFLTIAVATLFGIIDTSAAADWYYTGDGYPTNFAGNHMVYHKTVKDLEECKDLCNNNKDCTTITYNTRVHWCDVENNKANAFSLYPDSNMRTYTKTPFLEKLIDRTCGAAEARISTLKHYVKTEKDSVKTMKEYLESEKKYLREEEETNNNYKTLLTSDDKRIK